MACIVSSIFVLVGFSSAQISNQTVSTAPTNLNATAVSSSQINLSWTQPIDSIVNHVNGYKIEVSPTCTDSFSVLVANTTTTATTFASSGLTSGICYQYRVSALNPAGVGSPSNTAHATTLSVPAAPQSLTAHAVSSSQINLIWTAPSNTGGTSITGYKIERRDSCTGNFITTVSNTGNSSNTFSNTGLVNNTCYQYRVFANNAVGTSLSSNNATATTLQISNPIHVPNSPTGLSVAVLSDTALKLTWMVPSDQGGAPLIGYKIQRNGTTIVNNTGSQQTNFNNTGLLADHQQTYQVAAWNNAGLGPYSNVATGKTTTQISTNDSILLLLTGIQTLTDKITGLEHDLTKLKQQRDILEDRLEQLEQNQPSGAEDDGEDQSDNQQNNDNNNQQNNDNKNKQNNDNDDQHNHENKNKHNDD